MFFGLLFFSTIVVYISGPLQTFFQIMKLFEDEVKNPEDYAIFYLDVFAESLSGDVPMPWQGSAIQWNDPIKLFQVSLIIPIVTTELSITSGIYLLLLLRLVKKLQYLTLRISSTLHCDSRFCMISVRFFSC